MRRLTGAATVAGVRFVERVVSLKAISDVTWHLTVAYMTLRARYVHYDLPMPLV